MAPDECPVACEKLPVANDPSPDATVPTPNAADPAATSALSHEPDWLHPARNADRSAIHMRREPSPSMGSGAVDPMLEAPVNRTSDPSTCSLATGKLVLIPMLPVGTLNMCGELVV